MLLVWVWVFFLAVSFGISQQGLLSSNPCPLKKQGHVALEQTKRDLIPNLGGGSLNKALTVPEPALPQQEPARTKQTLPGWQGWNSKPRSLGVLPLNLV